VGDTTKKIVGGLVVVAVIGAVGLHASQLATLAKPAGSAAQGVLHTADTGND
jgi:hypothetical protein